MVGTPSVDVKVDNSPSNSLALTNQVRTTHPINILYISIVICAMICNKMIKGVLPPN